MNERLRDEEVDTWLRAKQPLLHGAGDASLPEPPPELDHRILEHARRALRPARADRPTFFRNPRSGMSFAIAATAVLSFALVLQFNRYESEQASLRKHAQRSAASSITLAPSSLARNEASSTSADDIGAGGSGAPTTAASRREAPVRSSTDKATRMRPPAPPPTAPSANAAELSSRVAKVANSPAAAAAVAAVAPAQSIAAPHRTANQWWQAVQQLRQEGHLEEAAAELKALRKAYPDFMVPTAAPETTQP